MWLSDRSELILLKEVILDEEYKTSLQAGNAKTIVDLGANVGISTMWFRWTNPRAKIVAVEPDPKTFAKLLRNVRHDPLVECVQAAIVESAGPVAFSSAPLSWASGVSATPADANITVPGITLDELFAARRLKHVDILKVDIEGMEWRVLPTTGSLRLVEEVVGELHPADGAVEDVDGFFDRVHRLSGLRRAPSRRGRLFVLRRG